MDVVGGHRSKGTGGGRICLETARCLKARVGKRRLSSPRWMSP